MPTEQPLLPPSKFYTLLGCVSGPAKVLSRANTHLWPCVMIGPLKRWHLVTIQKWQTTRIQTTWVLLSESLLSRHRITHTHTCTHAHVHTHTSMHTHKYIHAHIPHKYAHTCAYTHAYTYIHMYIHTCTHDTCTYICMQTYIYAHTYTHTCTRIHKYTYTYIHAMPFSATHGDSNLGPVPGTRIMGHTTPCPYLTSYCLLNCSSTCKRMQVYLYYLPWPKLKSKWIKDLRTGLVRWLSG